MKKGFLKIILLFSIPLLLVAIGFNSYILYGELNKKEIDNPKEKNVATFNKVGSVKCNQKFDQGDIDFAYAVFARFWNSEFEKNRIPNLKTSFSKICIEVGDKPLDFSKGFSVDGKFIEKGEAIGLTHSTEHIWVYASDEMKRISETSLVHELVHVTLMLQGTDGDADHEGKEIKEGWTKKHTDFIDVINAFLWMTGT